jgi:hypothetical protein
MHTAKAELVFENSEKNLSSSLFNEYCAIFGRRQGTFPPGTDSDSCEIRKNPERFPGLSFYFAIGRPQ